MKRVKINIEDINFTSIAKERKAKIFILWCYV